MIANETETVDARNMAAAEAQPLTTADLLSQERVQRTEAVTNGEKHDPLFAGNEAENFRGRWQNIQGSFVDEPRQAVQKADELVAAVIQRLTQVFADERGKMEHEWAQGQDFSTEDLRQALRRYRSFFDRLLSV